MLNNSDNVISGPVNNIPIPDGSMGKYFLDCMKNRDRKHVNMVDCATGNTLTNEEILQYSLKAAQILKDLGIKKGDVVTIIVENSAKYCILVLASLYIGAIANLLNPLYSVGELKHALSIIKPKVIVCSLLSLKTAKEVCHELQIVDAQILFFESTSENTEITSLESLLKTVSYIDPDSFKPEVINSVEDGAFILMSSGTTGLPKGVLLTHQNIRMFLNYLCHEDYFGVSNKDTTVVVIPFFHIFGVAFQVMSIALGMKLVVLSKFKPDLFLDSIQKYKATKMYIVPPILLFMAESPLISNYDISTIDDIVVGGAPVATEIQCKVIKRMKNTMIRQVYGCTEAGGASTLQTFNNIVLGSTGVLVPHMYMKVWDADLQEYVGVGKVGELCFKGAMIMKEYYGCKDATKDCIDEEGFLHSGDLGYYDEDGNIYVVDRLKELIKYKGFQVPPAELETLILTHPAVEDCGVIGIPDKRAGQVPLAYVVKQNGINVKEQDIIEYVAGRISIQKHLYGGVRFIEEIPRNATGKILRKKLLEIFQASQ